MKYEDLDNLVQGEMYNIKNLISGKSYKAEFRGFVTVDLYEMTQYVLFWIDGDSSASEFHYQDIEVSRIKD